MPLTAANSEPIQKGGLSGSAAIFAQRKKKKKPEPEPPAQNASQPTTAAIFARRKK